MFKSKKLEALRRFYEIPRDNNILVLFFDFSAIAVGYKDKNILFDIADILGEREIDELKNLYAVFYTHGHYDHFNLKSAISIFNKTNAYIIADPSVYVRLYGKIPSNKLIKAEGTVQAGDLKIKAFKGKHVGPITLYLVNLNGLLIFHGGDSDYIPLKGEKAHVAIVPVGDPSPTASPEAAFKMVKDLDAEIAIPIHGSSSQMLRFKDLIQRSMLSTKVYIAKQLEPLSVKL